MPTLVTVPATTGPKSHETGPEVLLMELPVCAVAVGVKPKISATARQASHGAKVAIVALNLCFIPCFE